MEMEQKARQIAELLKLLANEHRLLILCALTSGPLSVSQLHEHTPRISLSALSQHLGQLKAAGILRCEKQGMRVLYEIQDPRVLPLMETLKQQYCTEENA